MPSALAPSVDVRLRLEGQLELVERSVRALDEGAALLAQNDASELISVLAWHLAPDVQEAESHLREMAVSEPSLRATVATLEQARARFAQAVERRLLRLKLPTMPLTEAVAAIADEPIRYSTQWFRPAIPGLLLPGLLLPLVVIFAVLVKPSSLANMVARCALPAIVALGLVFYLYSNRATLTSKRLLIGSAAFDLAELALPQSDKGPQRLVHLTTGLSIGYDIVDAALFAALKAAGVVVKPL